MGYYSQVCIAIRNEYTKPLMDIIEQQPNHYLPSRVDEKGDITVIYYSGVKWYTPEVYPIINYLQTIDAEDYGLVRVGEDTTDIEECGSPDNFGMEVQTTIEVFGED